MLRRLALLLALASLAAGCGERDEKVRRIVYWEKWTGFEGEAVDRVVDAFNAREREKASRDPSYLRIEVQKVTISSIEQKLLVAVAGGNPPDVAGSYSSLVPAYADKGALTDLGPYARRAGIERDDYIEHFWDLGVHRGKLWALPSTPASTALHWNKRLFREAGLDPETPPRTLEELDAFAEKLTRWEVTLPDGRRELRAGYLPEVPFARKRLLQVGFLPNEPSWFLPYWGYFFGGRLLQGDRVSVRSPDNLRAYEWVASYTKKLGVDVVKRFRSGFGNFSSPSNPFMSGKVAMELQGVWMYHFIKMYAPGMQWGAAPFPAPADRPELAGANLAEADVLEIPKDSKHPEEAFEFIRYVSSQEGMELLCLGQNKFSPLRDVSEAFWREHPHPKIRMFRELATSPNAFATPKVGVWNELARELGSAVDSIQNLRRTPEQALGEVQQRAELAVERNARLIGRRNP